jgi:hypothetical protein
MDHGTKGGKSKELAGVEYIRVAGGSEDRQIAEAEMRRVKV